jgi:hypothetical protein
MKRTILILLLAASAAWPQTANVIELTPADQARTQKAWDALQKAQGEWNIIVADINGKYVLDKNHHQSEGFENGYTFSKDFRFIVPKVAEPKSNTWPNTHGFYPERYLNQLN